MRGAVLQNLAVSDHVGDYMYRIRFVIRCPPGRPGPTRPGVWSPHWDADPVFGGK
jgi:hypothetical protein